MIWKPPVPLLHLPVLYYVIQIVNGSDSDIDVQINTTNITTSLKGIEPGYTCYIVVYAVNVVGDGPNVTITG